MRIAGNLLPQLPLTHVVVVAIADLSFDLGGKLCTHTNREQDAAIARYYMVLTLIMRDSIIIVKTRDSGFAIKSHSLTRDYCMVW